MSANNDHDPLCPFDPRGEGGLQDCMGCIMIARARGEESNACLAVLRKAEEEFREWLKDCIREIEARKNAADRNQTSHRAMQMMGILVQAAHYHIIRKNRRELDSVIRSMYLLVKRSCGRLLPADPISSLNIDNAIKQVEDFTASLTSVEK